MDTPLCSIARKLNVSHHGGPAGLSAATTDVTRV